jgi:Fe-S-cluster containining protein
MSDSLMSVARPVVRQFKEKYAREAARHVRAGGHALVWSGEGRKKATLVLPPIDTENEHDLGYWALLDMGKYKWDLPKTGPYRGLAYASVPRSCFDIVTARAERDAGWEGATHTVELDCLACGSCCRDNKVVLEKEDIARFKAAGREDLARPPYTKKDAGKIVLKLLRSKDCRHLASDNKCGIYALRPDACSTFPVASECCLFSRQEELGIYDGIAPGK